MIYFKFATVKILFKFSVTFLGETRHDTFMCNNFKQHSRFPSRDFLQNNKPIQQTNRQSGRKL